MKTSNKIIDKFYSVIFIMVFIIIWQIAASKELINTFHFSSPLEIIQDLKLLFQTGEIWPHINATFGVSLIGLVYGTVSGVVIAFLFGNFKVLPKIFDPILVGLYGLPKLALGPLFIIWFGIGIQAKIFMSTIMVFFLVFFNAYAGFRDVDVDLINTLKIMGASKLQIILKVTLPSCVPWIAASLRAGAGSAVMGTIVGEYLGSNKGLGWMVQSAGGVYNITRVLSCIFILLFLMSLIDGMLKLMEKRILSWRQEN
ncbi:ABC transporter permease protein [Gottschalkia acidurici 9a]|uniref:ABC transporter permease protein n=1 Tax=Gottschalkia acidurici (strain ATCC 7906 / DSM 604 / BCRC 14475 / CIP 104303 / KCTC 5404 / NCIMB 10678 / 9a) TaxID=1128398 RepID=K0AZM1_GOTA9|nr:ABC transporter permease [Gottschalkia acidurici]AFS78165.1 ABC transporter permease protein [Gottschalkia acidurici 9a]